MKKVTVLLVLCLSIISSDIFAASDNCTAGLELKGSEYYVNIPVFKYIDPFGNTLHHYSGEFVYAPKGDGYHWFRLAKLDEISDKIADGSYDCQISILSYSGDNLMLYIDKLDVSGSSVSADLKYYPTNDGKIWFVLTDISTLTIEVDTTKVGATIRDLTGVNRKPVLSSNTPGGINWDGISLYSSFGISQIRLHDSDVDLCGTYTAATKLNTGVTPAQPVTGCQLKGSGGIPHFTWTPTSSSDAELNNPDNYDFTSVDEGISGAIATGASVYLRLGDSYNGPNDTDDPVAWAKVATNIYRHVLGKFKPTAGIAVNPVYVEVFNEPDGGFWQGKTETFNTLFKETVKRVRAAAAEAGTTVKIGGAGFTTNILKTSQQKGNPANGFIGAVGASTIDFFSAHFYSSCSTASLASSASFLRALRSVVNDQGGSNKPLHITEWNIGLGSQCGNDLYSESRLQSFSSGILTLMQDPAQNIEAAHFYAAMPIMAMFDFTKKDGTVRINPSAWAFKIHSSIRGANSLNAQVCPQGDKCVAGYAAESVKLMALAGQVDIGAQNVIVTNDGSSSVTYKLRLNGLVSSDVTATISTPPAGVKVLSGSGNPIIADTAELETLITALSKDTREGLKVNGGQIELTITIPSYSVQLIEVRTPLL